MAAEDNRATWRTRLLRRNNSQGSGAVAHKASDIAEVFGQKLTNAGLPKSAEINAALGAVLKDIPANASIGNEVVDGAVAHLKEHVTDGKYSADGVKASFGKIVDGLTGITEEARTAARNGIGGAVDTKLAATVEAAAQAGKTAGLFQKLSPFGGEKTLRGKEFLVNGKKVTNYGWSEGLVKDLEKGNRKFTPIAIKGAGAITAGAILVSAGKDFIGRTPPANDNDNAAANDNIGQEKERHIMKGLIKTAAAVGLGAVSVCNQTLGKEARVIAAGV